MMEKKVKGTAGSVPHNSDGGLTKIFGAGHLDGEQAPVQMRLQARLPSAERAFLPLVLPDTGQRTAMICLGVSFSGTTIVLSNLVVGTPTSACCNGTRARLRRGFHNPLRPPRLVGEGVREIGK